MKSKKWILFLILILIVFVLGYFVYSRFQSGEVMVTSVSSDGNYAITTDLSRKAILWNLKKHTKEILDRKANIYSAYFIKNSNNFMWQHDTNNEVIIKNTNGRVIQKFNPGFPTYGQIMTAKLKTYIASDEKWNIYKISFDEKSGMTKTILKKGLFAPGFIGAGKLMNLMFSPDEKYVLSSGLADNDDPLSKGTSTAENKHWSRSLMAGVVLWNLQANLPFNKYIGTVNKTFSTLSPDGKYIVGGDEGSWSYVWNINDGKKLFQNWSLWYGKPLGKNIKTGLFEYDNSKLKIMPPRNFKQYDGGSVDAIFALKFIDQTHYLRFTTYVPNYAILYSVTDPKPLKYLPLGKSPMISVDQYTRDQSIDTSPQAHILVTGKINQGGILVYKYDPKTQILNKVWNGR